MSNFFNKNRQPSGTRWQKKQTAVNSQNDRFTIYAHMGHNKSDNNRYIGGDYKLETETPISNS